MDPSQTLPDAVLTTGERNGIAATTSEVIADASQELPVLMARRAKERPGTTLANLFDPPGSETRFRALVDFLIDLSHELRTPLNGILGFAELMHDGKVGPVSSQHREFLGDILTSARQLQQLIDEILDRAKVEVNNLGPGPEKESTPSSFLAM